MNRLFILLLFGFILQTIGCSDRKTKLTIKFDRVDNLYKGAEVLLKGVSIGEVTKIKLLDSIVIVDIIIDKGSEVSSNSKCYINSPLIGSARIIIEPSYGSLNLRNGDTILGNYNEKDLFYKLDKDSINNEKIRESLMKIGEGFKELIEIMGDSANKNSDH